MQFTNLSDPLACGKLDNAASTTRVVVAALTGLEKPSGDVPE